jgi:flavin-dependent dehydrogenase
VSGTIDVDVLVVGARVAGSILAARLGSAGWGVLVVDRAAFPSDTLSTHFFRGAGCAAAVNRLGVLDDVLRAGAPRLVVDYNADALTGRASVDPPQDDSGELGFNLSVRRVTLDAILVERARREPTVEVRERVAFRSLVWDGERVAGAVVESEHGRTEVRSRYVVGADGHASRVARAAGAAVQEGVPPFRVLYYHYVRGLEGPRGAPDGPEFSIADDEMVYAFPSDGGITCVALSANLRDYARLRTNAEAGFRERLSAHPFIAPRLERAAWEGRLRACGPRPVEARVPVGPGWALVGDASMHVDPWTGEGMDNAAVHATFLAEALDDVLAERVSEAEALGAYHARRDDHALEGMRENVRLGRDLNQLREDPQVSTGAVPGKS